MKKMLGILLCLSLFSSSSFAITRHLVANINFTNGTSNSIGLILGQQCNVEMPDDASHNDDGESGPIYIAPGQNITLLLKSTVLKNTTKIGSTTWSIQYPAGEPAQTSLTIYGGNVPAPNNTNPSGTTAPPGITPTYPNTIAQNTYGWVLTSMGGGIYAAASYLYAWAALTSPTPAQFQVTVNKWDTNGPASYDLPYVRFNVIFKAPVAN